MQAAARRDRADQNCLRPTQSRRPAEAAKVTTAHGEHSHAAAAAGREKHEHDDDGRIGATDRGRATDRRRLSPRFVSGDAVDGRTIDDTVHVRLALPPSRRPVVTWAVAAALTGAMAAGLAHRTRRRRLRLRLLRGL